jgi:peptidoglycan/xylan/chitin deacetylase (PgdA/CDA1 family)
MLLRGVSGPPGSRLARLLGESLEPLAPLRGVGGCFERIVADVSVPGPELEAAGAGLPNGPARAEALALRLRERGLEWRWGEPVVVPDAAALLDLCRRRGRDSVVQVAADPALLPGLQIGSWFDRRWRARLRRRLPRGGSRCALASAARLTALADRAFWAGVEEAAAPELWQRLSSSSYVALVYHRFAGERKPGQERIDIAPGRFSRQLLALRLCGFRPLAAEELLAFHSGSRHSLPARSVAITVDDGLADCVGPLRKHARWRPQLFVPTAELGGGAHWIDGEPVASWGQIGALEAAGVAIGSHGRRHRRLGELDPLAREVELTGSLAELREHLTAPLAALAYPNGDHDERVCAAARGAGYEVAYTTAKGRNGAGTAPYALKRVSVHAADGVPAILWKALTGEGLPAFWLRQRGRLGALTSARRRG